ncbi:MAG: MFS transporter [Proteobacteria bacterium]|nr:MFS transporter [Pseudomonadota bacterium]MBI3498857.1 MFS transporter [Pseudomonadota bacterium]
MTADDGLPTPQRYRAIIAIALGITLAVLDGAIANVALPTIARDLHTSDAASIWVVNAYQLVITMSLLPLASAGDIYGYRRIYRAGLVLFTVFSLGCAISDSLTQLTAARVLQGVGAAGIMSVNSALLRFVYPRHMLGRGVAVNALVVALSSAIGPSVASAILAVAPWQWLFAVNVPIGLLAFLASGSLPRTPASPRRFDLGSALLNALTFGLFIIGLDGIGHGEGELFVVIEFAAALALGTALVLRQLSRAAPLLPIDLLRLPVFALSIATSTCSFAAQMMAYVSLPFYLQNVLGRTQVETGLLMTAWPLTVAMVAPISGRLADRHNAGLLGGIGLTIFAAGLLALAVLPMHPSSADIVWRMAVCGLGFALFQSPNNRTIITAAPKERSGGASGMLGTARLLGQTTGTALVAVLFGLWPEEGTTIALLTAAAFALGAAIVSSVRMLDFSRPGSP